MIGWILKETLHVKTGIDYIFRSIPTHFRIDTFQFQTESWLFKTTFFMFVCPKNRYQTGWKDYKLKQNIPNSGAYPFKGTFFRSIPVHPIFGGQKISFFRSMSVHFWKLIFLLSALSGAYPFTDWPFSFSGAYPFTRMFYRTFAAWKSPNKAKAKWQENQQVWVE